MLRAAADPTRLRLLLVLRQAELTVSELTQILGQSQPRVSRHLKLLCDAGLLQRFKEGSWVFYRSAERGEGAELGALLAALAEREADALESDRRRLAAVREARAAEAAAFFKDNAAEWERIRSLHAPEKDVEAAIAQRAARRAGRVFARCRNRHGPDARIAGAGDQTRRRRGCEPRNACHRARPSGARAYPAMPGASGRYVPPAVPGGHERSGFDAALFHQVLHYLDDPQAALAEAARVLKPGGRILIVDFAPHEFEFLRSEFAHRRLGFLRQGSAGLVRSAGSEIRRLHSHRAA